MKDFEQFARLKAKLKDALKDSVWIEERKIARGHVTFSIRSKKSPEALRQTLAALSLEPGRLVPVMAQAGESSDEPVAGSAEDVPTDDGAARAPAGAPEIEMEIQ